MVTFEKERKKNKNKNINTMFTFPCRSIYKWNFFLNYKTTFEYTRKNYIYRCGKISQHWLESVFASILKKEN